MASLYRHFPGAQALVFSLGLLASGLVFAEPQDGFGLALGPVAHSAHITIAGVKQHYTSSGAGLTADAQFVFSNQWSINPSIQFALEKARGDITDTLTNSQAGLQLRHWSGNGFVAPILIYSVEDVISGGVVRRAEYGPGIGIMGGWEAPAGLTLAVQADAPESLFFSSSKRRAGLWLQIGYRWH